MSDRAATCRYSNGYGRCGRTLKHGGPHAVFIGGGSDPIYDPEVWFFHGRGILPGYRSTRFVDHITPFAVDTTLEDR